jgi:hypothetical protein
MNNKEHLIEFFSIPRPKKTRRINATVRRVEAAGYVIEKHGNHWEVWHTQLKRGCTAHYDRLSDIPASPRHFV